MISENLKPSLDPLPNRSVGWIWQGDLRLLVWSVCTAGGTFGQGYEMHFKGMAGKLAQGRREHGSIQKRLGGESPTAHRTLWVAGDQKSCTGAWEALKQLAGLKIRIGRQRWMESMHGFRVSSGWANNCSEISISTGFKRGWW